MLFSTSVLLGALLVPLAFANPIPEPRDEAHALALFERGENSHLKARFDHEKRRLTCTVTPLGSGKDDVPNIMAAVAKCGTGGTIVFPKGQRYAINQKLNPRLSNVIINWYGTLVIKPDMTYWAAPNNAFPIYFQNHVAALVLSGTDIVINNGGTGGVDGSGEIWYDRDRGNTKPGRPMPFVLWNVTRVEVHGFRVVQPALWSFNIMGGKDILVEDLYCNATAANAPGKGQWVVNTDGFDTMDCQNVTLRGLTYQGGDDCIAIKPRSFNITATNITCHGGEGIAIGSVGQYTPEDNSVSAVLVKDVKVYRNGMGVHGCYIKTWIGEAVKQTLYESGGLPRGGGKGTISNIRFENFELNGPDYAAMIVQNTGDTGGYAGTSNILVHDITYTNFHGTTGKGDVSVSCSTRQPCYNIRFNGFAVTGATANTCKWIKPGGVIGITGTGC